MPAAAPPAGGYELGALVYLTTTTEGAAIYYTTDGTDPTVSEDLRYTDPIPIILGNGLSLTIKALAAKEGMTTSGVLEAKYTLPGLRGTVTILGEPEGGHILRAEVSFAEEAETTTNYQWLRGETADTITEPIRNAVAETYVITPDDQGMYLTVAVSRDTLNEGALYAEPVLIRAPSFYWTAIPGGTADDPGQSGFGETVINDIIFIEGKYLAVGAGGKIAWSGDGLAWTAIRPGVAVNTTRFPTTAAVYGVAYGAGKFVVVGQGGKIAYSTNGSVWTGIDPGSVSFTTTTFPSDVIIRDVTFGNGKFFALGKGSAFSSNGTQWTANTITTGRNESYTYYASLYVNGTWFAAGVSDYAYAGARNGAIHYSTDEGHSWTEATQAQTAFPAAAIYALAFNGEKFVAGGAGGRIAWSDDGITWTAIPPGTQDRTSAAFGNSAVNGIAWGAGKWIAVGAAGKMAQSEDGTQWEAIPPGTGPYTAGFGNSAIQGVAFCDGRFYAVGSGGGMAYSNQVTSSN
jgi:hypothetical protein